MTPPATTRTCAARNAAGQPCQAPVMRAAAFCSSHNDALPAERRFGSPEQAKAAGRLGGRPRKYEQVALAIDAPDGPASDPKRVLERAAWSLRIRGVATLNPEKRVAYDTALEHLAAAYRVRDQAALDEDALLEAEAKRRIPGFIDAIGELAGAGPWPR